MQLCQVGVLQGLLYSDALAWVKLQHTLHQVYGLGRGIRIHGPEVHPLQIPDNVAWAVLHADNRPLIQHYMQHDCCGSNTLRDDYMCQQ